MDITIAEIEFEGEVGGGTIVSGMKAPDPRSALRHWNQADSRSARETKN